MKKVYVVTRKSDYFEFSDVIYGVYTSIVKAETAIKCFSQYNKDNRAHYDIKETNLDQ